MLSLRSWISSGGVSRHVLTVEGDTRQFLSAVPHMYRVEEFSAKSQQQHQQKYKAPNHLETWVSLQVITIWRSLLVVLLLFVFVFFFFLLSYPDCASHVPPHPPNRDREVRAVRHRISFRVFLNGIKNALICIFSVILLNPKLAHLWFKTCFKFREEKINGYIFKVF